MYKVIYLPLAVSDLRNIVDYIQNRLKASEAAIDLVNQLDNSIARLEQFPYSCRVYQPAKELEDEYRLLQVKNYIVFYTVKNDKVMIYRIVYSKMDLTKVLSSHVDSQESPYNE
ncbi:type II toxin-antitoxin system RelE/ParE family toxin [Oceanobacillus jeddahense]|uniref:Type II toxin-antitoxin system RelE/ParE family toxin n=1 Tax=Oceanobacillus jeddahense TaxID=1462527 RepID=A0ABY5JW57_9BACI|nr:type II toxin-antitoxin system RelE/ParE family toxin [Oceanobacillus jeddahense]UUI04566.1 type II toxin-antitoxin system RelE/ParE family toxin [Oceanobacillus jeddahense]